MFSQYFGQYLLNKGLLSAEQLREALAYERSANPKLGVLAIDAGFMTAAQVEKVHFLQHSLDKRFGEIAVEKKYLSVGQLEDLLRNQKSKRLSLGQVVVDKGYLSLPELESALDGYKQANKLTADQLDALNNRNFDQLVRLYLDFSAAGAKAALLYDYVALALRCILRILDEEPAIGTVFTGRRLITQAMTGDITVTAGIAMNDDTVLKLARRYSGEDITAVDELALDCVAEFFNEVNGLFTVNMSDQGLELNLQPPQIPGSPALFNEAYRLAISTSCGLVSLQLTVG